MATETKGHMNNKESADAHKLTDSTLSDDPNSEIVPGAFTDGSPLTAPTDEVLKERGWDHKLTAEELRTRILELIGQWLQNPKVQASEPAVLVLNAPAGDITELTQQRKEFEAWASNRPITTEYRGTPEWGTINRSQLEELTWEAWQAGRSSLESERDKQWSEWGIIEVAIRNPSVAAYCKHWEGRTEKAESECARLLKALRQIEHKGTWDGSDTAAAKLYGIWKIASGAIRGGTNV